MSCFQKRPLSILRCATGEAKGATAGYGHPGPDEAGGTACAGAGAQPGPKGEHRFSLSRRPGSPRKSSASGETCDPSHQGEPSGERGRLFSRTNRPSRIRRQVRGPRRTRQCQPHFYCCASDSRESPWLMVRQGVSNSPRGRTQGLEGVLGPPAPRPHQLEKRGRGVSKACRPRPSKWPRIRRSLTPLRPRGRRPPGHPSRGSECRGGAVTHPLPPNSFRAKLGGAEIGGKYPESISRLLRESRGRHRLPVPFSPDFSGPECLSVCLECVLSLRSLSGSNYWPGWEHRALSPEQCSRTCALARADARPPFQVGAQGPLAPLRR